MITCRELVELLADFVSDQLPREHRDHLEHHLGSCSSCVAYVESYLLTIQLTQRLPRSPLPGELCQCLQAILEQNWEEGTGRTEAIQDEK